MAVRVKETTLWPLWEAGQGGVNGVTNSKSDLMPGVHRTSISSMDLVSVRGGDMLTSNTLLGKLMIHPEARLRLVWDLLSIFVLVVDIVLIPLFLLPIEHFVITGIGLLIMIFWATDIVISFCSAYHDLGFVEMRPSKVAAKYIRGWFCIDFTCCAVDIGSLIVQSAVVDVVGLARFGKVARVSRLLRLLRLLRAMKIVRILNTIRDYVHSTTLFTCLGVGRTMLGILLVCHYLACLLYTVGTFNHDEQDSWLTTLHRSDIGYVYITALHWSITQFTPGSMEVQPRNPYERAFAICTIMLGLVAFSSFISSITAAMAQLHKSRETRLKQTGDIRQYIMENRISLQLGSTIMAFMKTYDFNAQGRIHESDLPVFAVLPESIRRRLRYEIYHPYLMKHPLLLHVATMEAHCAVGLCQTALNEQSLLLSQDLFTADEQANNMYFIVQGVVEYFHGWDDTRCKECAAGTWVCEVVLWVKWDHRGRLSALTPAELMMLDAKLFRRTIGRFPEVHVLCAKFAALYLKRTNQAPKGEPIDTWCDMAILSDMLEQARADKPRTSEFRRGWSEDQTGAPQVSSPLPLPHQLLSPAPGGED